MFMPAYQPWNQRQLSLMNVHALANFRCVTWCTEVATLHLINHPNYIAALFSFLRPTIIKS